MCGPSFPDGPAGPEGEEICTDPEYIGSNYVGENCYDDGTDENGDDDDDPCLDPVNFNTVECGGDGDEEEDPDPDPCGLSYNKNGDHISSVCDIIIDINRANICGTYSVLKVGDSYTGTVNNLGFTVTVNGETATFINLGTCCFQLPSYNNMSGNDASNAFVAAYNLSLYTTMTGIHNGIIPVENTAIRASFLATLRFTLNEIKPGSSFSTAACAGNVPQTNASFCSP